MEPVAPKSFQNLPYQYVITMKSAEWNRKKAVFDIGMDLDPDLQDTGSTRAEVNYDSLTGGFNIPARENVPGDNHVFAFSLDEKGVIFIDDEGFCNAVIRKIANTKRLVNPCLERFLYDFLEQIICDDRKMLESYDHTLDELEDQILDGNTEGVLEQIAEIRNDLRDLKIHYTQLIDVCQELEENENHFFKDENERYFHLVAQRIERLLEMLLTLVDFTIQLREFCQSKIDEKQNRNLAFLTIISSIFMPLTLIAGWYGMNFKYMPELDKVWAYPLVFVVSVMIVVVCIVFFKKNKWF
ncbi:MAG: CorA family divalent cation transporter [Eubacteriales bacterium]